MNQRKEIKKKWLLYAVGGLLLIGFGMSLFGQSVILKYEQANFIVWFGAGTLSLILLNAGVSVFGQAVVFKVKLDDYQDKTKTI
ncbi:MAG TPA: hypothetical protein VK957_21130 [Lunatimonas sp.]|nr:hypothetical protein [Lunatimonas sp.]